jgi:hypothetical protein
VAMAGGGQGIFTDNLRLSLPAHMLLRAYKSLRAQRSNPLVIAKAKGLKQTSGEPL